MSLKDEDAQCLFDYLDDVSSQLTVCKALFTRQRYEKILREKGGILATEEGISVLSLLYALTQSTQVFPRCYELKGIDPDKCEHIAKGTFSEVFRAYHEGQTLCLMATRRISGGRSRSVSSFQLVKNAHSS